MLTDQPGGNILVAGSGQLVRWLIGERLVDESGSWCTRSFSAGVKRLSRRRATSTAACSLTKAQPYESGIVVLTYEPAAEE